jgi:hypothetical protein
MTENGTCPATFDRSLSYRILTKSLKQFMGYIENPFVTACKLGLIMGQ